jgi:hypothetical protein
MFFHEGRKREMGVNYLTIKPILLAAASRTQPYEAAKLLRLYGTFYAFITQNKTCAIVLMRQALRQCSTTYLINTISQSICWVLLF